MPTIANAPSGEDTSLDGTEKFPVSGSKFVLISTIRDYIWNYLTSLTAKTSVTGADQLAIADSAASNVGKKVTITNFLASIFASPTFTGAPTLTGGDFTNLAHDHGDTNDGGVLVAAAITGLHGYSIIGMMSTVVSPNDATTYYIGMSSRAPNTTEGLQKVSIPRTGTLKAAYVMFDQNGTTGTDEVSTINFRYNATTDTAISAVVQNDQNVEVFSNTGLSVAVTAGGTFELKWVTPTWVTNPTNIRVSWILYIQE